MMMASYASQASQGGRMHREEALGILATEDFLEDRNRVVNSVAFRRLECKMQVFPKHLNDHYRSRLTHSLEVANIAKTISRSLRLNEDLAETIALVHDLGHPPFGHAGEDVLQEAMSEYGGFNHNLHALKILIKLEKRFKEFDGLNLTWETLEGVAKHNGPIASSHPLSQKVQQLLPGFDLRLDKYPSLEAQVAGLSDDIAYCTHDIEDGLRAGLFAMEELSSIALVSEIMKGYCQKPGLVLDLAMSFEIIYALRQKFMLDLIMQTENELKRHRITRILEVRGHTGMIAKFSPAIEEAMKEIKNFLMQRVYRNHKIQRIRFRTKKIIKGLFQIFMECPECLPVTWYDKISSLEMAKKADVVSDYIAGMTDRFAIAEHHKLFDLKIKSLE